MTKNQIHDCLIDLPISEYGIMTPILYAADNWTWTGFAKYWRQKLDDDEYEEMMRCMEEEK